MEKSDSIEINDDGFMLEAKLQGNNEQATSSNRKPVKPDHIADNMNDLQPIDLNSADAVRQAMKAVLGGKVPPPYSQELNHPEILNNIDPDPRSKFLPMGQYIPTIYSTSNVNRYGHKQKQLVAACKRCTVGNAKRRGRPPKAGSSKKISKQRVSSMYVGKLSNVVPFRRRWRAASESEESVVILY